MRGGKGAGGGGHRPRSLKHPSPDDLLLYGYREVRTAPTERHLTHCEPCRERLRVLRRDGAGTDSPRRPPVWRRIYVSFAGLLRRT